MTGRPRATTHWAIRDAAIEMFIADGYAETSLEAIAKECGISRTTLFAYFRAKSDILVYGDERNIERILSFLDDAPHSVPAGEVIRRMARTMRALPFNAREELSVYWKLRDENEDVSAKAVIVSRRYERAIADFIRLRLESSEADPLPELFAGAVSGVLVAAARYWTAHPAMGPSLEDFMEASVASLVKTYLGDR